MRFLFAATPAIAIVWALCVLAQIAGMAVAPGYWSQPEYGPALKAWFFAREAVFGALLAVAAGSAFAALGSPRVPRGLRLAGDALVCGLLTALLVTSWGQYSLLGDFLGVEAVRMVWADFGQIVLHARAFAATQLLLGVPVLLALVAGLMYAMHALQRRRPDAFGPRLLALLVGALLVASLYSAVAGPVLRRGFAPQPAGLADARALAFLRSAQRAGPLSYLRDDVLNTLHGPIPPLVRAPGLYSRPPLEPLAAWQARAAAGANHRSVVVLVIESLRPDVIRALRDGGHGGDAVVMPTVEALAAGSTRFHDVYSQSSHSNYADTSIVSSQYPLRARGVHYFPEHPGYPRVLLQDLLGGLGYRSALFSSQDESWGGMKHFAGSAGFERSVHADNFEGDLRAERILYRDPGFQKYVASMRSRDLAGKIDDAVTIALARDWLASLPDGQPFYLHLNLQNSHLPYFVPADYPRRFFLETGAPLEALRSGRLIELTAEQMHAAYLDALGYMDQQIGQLVDALKAGGRWDDTVFVVTGDTATSFYTLTDATSDGHVTKVLGNGGMLIEEVVRVPLLMRVPGRPAEDMWHRVQHIDVMPGVLGALGLPPHPGMQGADPFVPVDRTARPVFLTAQTPAAMQYAVVFGDWKLTYDAQLQRYMLEFLGRGAPPPAEAAARVVPLLSAELSAWAGEQLAYYEDPDDWTAHYAPVRAPAR